MGELSPWYIKICGVTTLGDANAVIDAGANALGLILTKSPRRLSLDRALAIAAATKGRIVRTAVFNEESDDVVLQAVDLLDVDAVQLHGPLSEGLRSALRERELTIVKALSIGSDEFFDFDEGVVDLVHIDGARRAADRPTPGSNWRRGHSVSPSSPPEVFDPIRSPT